MDSEAKHQGEKGEEVQAIDDMTQQGAYVAQVI